MLARTRFNRATTATARPTDALRESLENSRFQAARRLQALQRGRVQRSLPRFRLTNRQQSAAYNFGSFVFDTSDYADSNDIPIDEMLRVVERANGARINSFRFQFEFERSLELMNSENHSNKKNISLLI